MEYNVPEIFKYVGKYVRATAIYGKDFTGRVVSYDDEFENESGENSIVIDWEQTYFTELNESEIASIEVLGE